MYIFVVYVVITTVIFTVATCLVLHLYKFEWYFRMRINLIWFRIFVIFRAVTVVQPTDILLFPEVFLENFI